MSSPNSALAAWQLTVIAVVAVGTLAGWLIAVYLAARPPSRAASVAAGPVDAPTSGTGAAPAAEIVAADVADDRAAA